MFPRSKQAGTTLSGIVPACAKVLCGDSFVMGTTIEHPRRHYNYMSGSREHTSDDDDGDAYDGSHYEKLVRKLAIQVSTTGPVAILHWASNELQIEKETLKSMLSPRRQYGVRVRGVAYELEVPQFEATPLSYSMLTLLAPLHTNARQIQASGCRHLGVCIQTVGLYAEMFVFFYPCTHTCHTVEWGPTFFVDSFSCLDPFSFLKLHFSARTHARRQQQAHIIPW